MTCPRLEGDRGRTQPRSLICHPKMWLQEGRCYILILPPPESTQEAVSMLDPNGLSLLQPQRSFTLSCRPWVGSQWAPDEWTCAQASLSFLSTGSGLPWQLTCTYMERTQDERESLRAQNLGQVRGWEAHGRIPVPHSVPLSRVLEAPPSLSVIQVCPGNNHP